MRQAVAQAFQSAAGLGQAWTSAEVAQALIAAGWVLSLGRSERDMLRHTLGNMVAAGELVRMGTRKLAGVKRPVPLYALVQRPDPLDAMQSLAKSLRNW